MKFEYWDGEQRTPEWFDKRLGVVTASRLIDWLAVSKAKNSLGKPLKARLDYEKELLYEQRFNVSYDNFVSAAMQDGIDYEAFALTQYEAVTGNKIDHAGCWYNEYFVGSPDGLVGEDGLVEAKVIKDNTFTDTLVVTYDKKDVEKEHPIEALSEQGSLKKFWMQCQGQLWSSGKKWCDFVAINLSTKKIKVIRVFPDKDFHEFLELSITTDFNLTTEIFNEEGLYDFTADPFKEVEPQFLEGKKWVEGDNTVKNVFNNI